MRAGQLRHRIVIQSVTETRDSFGQPQPSWSTFAERYAEILPQSGREYLAARTITPELTHLVRLRGVTGVTPKMRVLLGTRVLDILAAVPVEERTRELLLTCRELVAT